jgi:hypothetical protein
VRKRRESCVKKIKNLPTKYITLDLTTKSFTIMFRFDKLSAISEMNSIDAQACPIVEIRTDFG